MPATGRHAPGLIEILKSSFHENIQLCSQLFLKKIGMNHEENFGFKIFGYTVDRNLPYCTALISAYLSTNNNHPIS